MSYQTKYKTAQLSKLEVFYREAANPEYPTVLLLHGCPSSSHLFRNLIPALAPYVHLVAPDLPGFGNTESPIDGSFDYTFNNLAIVVGELVEHLGLKSYFIYVMDFGAPTGFRLAIAHPERVIGLIAQNENAYEEGLTRAWAEIRNYWDDHSPDDEKALLPLLTLDFTKLQYVRKKSPSSLLMPGSIIFTSSNNPGVRRSNLTYITTLKIAFAFTQSFMRTSASISGQP